MKFFIKAAALCVLVLLVSLKMLRSEELYITSPNGKLKVVVNSVDGDNTTYALWLKDATVTTGNHVGWRKLIDKSVISMTVTSGATTEVWGRDATVSAVTIDSSTVQDPIIAPLMYGKVSSLKESYRALTLTYSQGYSLVVRAYDEGVAYRFTSSFADGVKAYVKDEQANFNFAEAATVWYPAVDNNLENFERWYVKFDSIGKVDTTRFDSHNSNNNFRWCITPVLFGFDKGEGVKVAITESDLHNYPALYMKRSGTRGIKGVWEYYPATETQGDLYTGPKVLTRADYIAVNTGAHKYPWRVVMVAEEDKDLLTNQLVLKLASSQSADYNFEFVRNAPSKSAWEYWHDALLEIQGVADGWTNVGYNLYKHYIDFAKSYGFKYITIDTDGQHNMTQRDFEKLIEYGKNNGVSIVKWAYIGEIMYNQNRLQELKDLGVACVKVDFFYRTDQKGMEVIEKLAKDAARVGITLLLHGCPVPNGLDRMYPNILNYEAVCGEENYKWDPISTDGRLPDTKYHVEFPFIRMLAGPVDFTPGSMRNVHKPQYSPVWNGIPTSIGTRAHELSMYVIFDQYLAYLSDNPTEYYKRFEVMRFLSKVPTIWDESIALDGKVGKYILMAKRKGKAWYVGGMVGETAHDFSLSGLAPILETLQGSYEAILYSDDRPKSDNDATAMTVKKMTLEELKQLSSISCSYEGGFALQLYIKGSTDDPSVKTSAGSTKSDSNTLQAFTNTEGTMLNITSEQPIVTATVINIQGAVVATQQYAGASLEEAMNIANLSTGIYVVSVKTKLGTHALKFYK
ncbi:MAG: glycoside hydrolase family 97 catalytic domain-containing protein [Prevotellaceae bacterium]|nr:glycoside hydrolase family 97 catalytic domain-containing protein [Prevotellaceae bacterium]